MALTGATLLLYSLWDIPIYPQKALPLLWCFFSWNFYAYAFDKRMWPWQFVELHGHNRGMPGWRTFWFWFTVIQYAALLATIAWVA